MIILIIYDKWKSFIDKKKKKETEQNYKYYEQKLTKGSLMTFIKELEVWIKQLRFMFNMNGRKSVIDWGSVVVVVMFCYAMVWIGDSIIKVPF